MTSELFMSGDSGGDALLTVHQTHTHTHTFKSVSVLQMGSATLKGGLDTMRGGQPGINQTHSAAEIEPHPLCVEFPLHPPTAPIW